MLRIFLFSLALVQLAGAYAATIYTGDRLQGQEVVSKLDVTTLPKGQSYHYYLQTMKNSLGHYWYVPVTVIRGAKEGKKLLVIAGAHGDESASLALVARLRQAIIPESLTGTITLVHGLNQSGLLANAKGFQQLLYHDLFINDLVTTFNSKADLTASPALDFTQSVWHSLFAANADYLVNVTSCGHDFQCSYKAIVYADQKQSLQLAQQVGADTIFLQAQTDKQLLQVFYANGSHGFTLRVGKFSSKVNQMTRATEGLLNLLVHLQMLSGQAVSYPSHYANRSVASSNQQSGYVAVQVKINQQVAARQRLAQVTNQFGEVIATLHGPAGKVSAFRQDPLSESGKDYVLIDVYDQGHKSQLAK